MQTKMHNSYSEEPIKTHTCKLLWIWPLVSIWLHMNIELKPAVCSEPRQNRSCDSMFRLTKDNLRSEQKILGNTARLNYYQGKLNILHCFIIFVETNTMDKKISFRKNWVSVWILILHRKPPNRLIWQEATVNQQKKKKKRKRLWSLVK